MIAKKSSSKSSAAAKKTRVSASAAKPKKVIASKSVPQVAEEKVYTNSKRIQTAEGWKRTQLRLRQDLMKK